MVPFTCSGKLIFTSTRTHLDMLWLDKESGALDLWNSTEDWQMYEEGEISDEEHAAYARLLELTVYLDYSRKSEFEEQVFILRIEGIWNGNDYACHEQHPVICCVGSWAFHEGARVEVTGLLRGKRAFNSATFALCSRISQVAQRVVFRVQDGLSQRTSLL